MLTPKKVQARIDYWMTESKEKFKTMQSLHTLKRYSDCLFFGHLVLEMVLKALAVRQTKKEAPYTHNLLRLAHLVGLSFDKDEIDLLITANRFNISARYPSEKLAFHKLCTKTYTDSIYNHIVFFYKKACQELKSKK